MAKKNAVLAEGYNITIPLQLFNDVYLPYLETIHRYEIYYGGSSSGKSNFIAHKLSLQLTMMVGRNLICLRKQGTDVKKSCYGEIRSAMKNMELDQFWDWTENPMPKGVNRVNGNTILFDGMDSSEDIKSIKFTNGTNLTDIWYEEATQELDKDNMKQLSLRLRGGNLRKRIIVSFNPVYSGHWLKEWIEKDLKNRNVMVLRTTYRDNKFLNQEDIDEIEQYKISDPYYYMVYGMGQWGVTGLTVFNSTLINNRIQFLMTHYQSNPSERVAFNFDRTDDGHPIRGTFKPYKTVDGCCFIYEWPIKGHPYAAAFDTAGEGSDFWALHIFDNFTGRQVAVYHSDQMPNICIFQVYGLLCLYNNALVAPEVNFDGYALEKLHELKYHRIYRRDAHPEKMDVKIEPKWGWRTTPENRQMMLSELVEWTVSNIDKIYDLATLYEMLTFTRQGQKKKGIFWAAEPGAHDDLVIALAIWLQIREQQRAYIEEEAVALEGFYMPEELDFAVESGRLTKREAKILKGQMLSQLGIELEPPKQRRTRSYVR